MLKKKERLSRKEFDTVYKTGRRFSTPHLSGIVAPQTRGACAVVVSKKTARNATERNSLRRCVYTVLGEVRSLWTGRGVVIILKSGAVHLSLEEIRTELENVLHNSVCV